MTASHVLRSLFDATMNAKPCPWNDPRPGVNGRPIAENFGAWFSGSKVVDGDGLPLVVYHSTFASFDTFEKTHDLGFHFASAQIADKRADEASGGRGRGQEKYEGFNIIPAYLRIRNPLHLSEDPGAWSPDYVLKLLGDAIPAAVKQRLEQLGEENLKAAREEAREMIEARAKGVRRVPAPSWDKGPPQYDLVNRVWCSVLDKHYVGVYTAMREALEDAGYDGLSYVNEVEGVGRGRKKRAATMENLTWVAFGASQVKSALSNTLFLPQTCSLTDMPAALAFKAARCANSSATQLRMTP